MKNIIKKMMFIGCATASLSVPSFAGYPVYVDGLVVGMNPGRPMYTYDTKLDTDLNRWINGTSSVGTTSVIGAIQSLQEQTVANTNQMAKMNGNYATTNDSRRVVGNVQAATLNRANQVLSGASVCNVISGNITGSNMGTSVAAWREEQIQQDLSDYLGNNKTSPTYKGVQYANKVRVNEHCSFGATQAEVDAGLCPKPTADTTLANGGVAGTAVQNLVGSDLNFNTLFHPKNGVYTKQGMEAASLWKNHAFADTMLGPLPAGVSNNPDQMAEEAGRRYTQASQFSASDLVFSDLISERAPFDQSFSNSSTTNVGTYATSDSSSSNSTATIRQWAEGTSKQVIGYNQSGNNFPNGVSQDAYLELRSKGWYWNPNWAVAVGGNSADQNSKDISLMMAFSVYQNYLLYEKTEMTNSLLALILHKLEKSN